MDKIWLKNYQEGVPYTIDIDEYASVVALFEKACERYAEHKAYTNFGVSLTYQRLRVLSTQFARYLQHLGLRPHDRVAIMLPNILQYPVVLFGILSAGCIAVNTNPLYTSDEVVHQLNDCQASTLIVLSNFAHTVAQARSRLPHLKQIIITEMGDLFPCIKRYFMYIMVHTVKRMVPDYHLPNAIPFRSIFKQKLKPLVGPRPTHKDTAFIQYTGGTTGVSKGAVLSHGNLVANVLQASAWIRPLNVNTEDKIVTALPLYHIFSLTANCLTFLTFGSENILITNPRDLKRLIHDIQHRQITAFTGVNTLFNALLQHPSFNRIDFSKLKLSLSGGMALQQSVSLAWQSKTHSRILEAYGLTETSPAVTINPMYIETYNGSIGLPLPSTDISIRNDEGEPVHIGEIGELCVKGPQVMSHYWQHDHETKLVFWPDGFLRTGDIARVNDEGFVFLVDRKKDMILVSGFNVYPNEIEQIIGQLPGVLEVGVIGVPREDGNEIVKACVVKKDPHLTEQDILKHCRQHLAAYKIPKQIAFFDALPKSHVGKILKRVLQSS